MPEIVKHRNLVLYVQFLFLPEKLKFEYIYMYSFYVWRKKIFIHFHHYSLKLIILLPYSVLLYMI